MAELLRWTCRCAVFSRLVLKSESFDSLLLQVRGDVWDLRRTFFGYLLSRLSSIRLTYSCYYVSFFQFHDYCMRYVSSSELHNMCLALCVVSFSCLSVICTDVSLSGETSAACPQRGRIVRSFARYHLTAHRRLVRLKVQQSSHGWRFSTQGCRVMWHDKTVMSWDGRWDRLTFTMDGWYKGQKHTVSTICCGCKRVCLPSLSYRRLSVTQRQVAIKICKKASNNQLYDILI